MPVVLDNDVGHRVLLYIGDVVAERVVNNNAAVGTNTLTSAAVPTAKKWRVTHIAARDLVSAITRIEVEVLQDADVIDVRHVAAPAANQLVEWQGELFLEVGDVVRANFFGCVAGDDIVLSYSGEQFGT